MTPSYPRATCVLVVAGVLVGLRPPGPPTPSSGGPTTTRPARGPGERAPAAARNRSENCVYCRKQDATTFQDAGVVALLNGRFVPLKVDGNRETAWPRRSR
jgi:hypothetical protein